MSRPDVSGRELVRSSAVVATGTALSRITGFLRVAAIATIGFGHLSDVYNIANNTPNIIYELLLGGILTATLVPLYVEYLHRDDERGPAAINTVAIAVLLVAVVVGTLLAPWIIKAYFIGIHRSTRAEEEQLATAFLRLFMAQILFYGIATLASAMLNARRRFVAAAFAPVLNNVVVIAVLVALPTLTSARLTVSFVNSNSWALLLLGLGTTAGIAAMAVALLPALHRAGTALRITRHWKHPAVSKLVRLSGWTVGYVVANQIAFWVAILLANRHEAETSVYLAAFAFFQLPHGLFAVSIMTTIMPELSSYATRGDIAAFRSRFAAGMRLLALVIVPAACVMIVMAKPIVVAVLQHGDFTPRSATLTAETLAAFGVGLVAFSAYLYALRAFYALQDTRSPFLLNCFENLVNIALALALYPSLGVQGLALAWALAYVSASIAALASLRRRISSLEGRRTARSLRDISLAAVALTAVAWIVTTAIGYAQTGRAVLASAAGLTAGGVVYLAVLSMLRLEELRLLRSAFRRPAPAESNTGM